MAGNYGLLNMYMPTFRAGTTALSAPALSLPDLSFGGTGIPSATIPSLESLDVTAELSKAMTLSPIKTGTLDVSTMPEFTGQTTKSASSSANTAWGDGLGVAAGAFTAINNLNANIEAYNKAKENYETAQLNALNIFNEADEVAEDMRSEADAREASNMARNAGNGLTAQAYDNLILSDRVQTEKDVLAMKENAQFEAINMLNTARRIKSRQKRKATVGAVGTAVLAIATAGAGLAAAGVFGAAASAAVGGSALSAMSTTLSIGNAINSGITGAMSNGG